MESKVAHASGAPQVERPVPPLQTSDARSGEDGAGSDYGRRWVADRGQCDRAEHPARRDSVDLDVFPVRSGEHRLVVTRWSRTGSQWVDGPGRKRQRTVEFGT